jgi:hypothetical protein
MEKMPRGILIPLQTAAITASIHRAYAKVEKERSSSSSFTLDSPRANVSRKG